MVEGEKGVGLGESGYFDSEIYDSGGGKSKYDGYVTSIAANDEVDDEEEDVGFTQKRAGFGTSVAFFNDVARVSLVLLAAKVVFRYYLCRLIKILIQWLNVDVQQLQIEKMNIGRKGEE